MPFQRKYRKSKAVAVAFAEFSFSVGLQQQRQVDKFRSCIRPSESFIQQHVERSRRQPFFAADDVGHAHQMVVDYVGQMICGQVVGAFI